MTFSRVVASRVGSEATRRQALLQEEVLWEQREDVTVGNVFWNA